MAKKLSSIDRFIKKTNKFPENKVIEVTVSNILGQGRGSIWFNTETPMTFENGLVMTDYDGYDEDEDFDDFGSQYYNCTLKGTQSQILDFLDGEYEIIDGHIEIDIND